MCLLYLTGASANKSLWLYATLLNVGPMYTLASETTRTAIEAAKLTLCIATVSAATQQASKINPAAKKRKAS